MRQNKLHSKMWKQVVGFVNKVNSCARLEKYYLQLLADLKDYIPYDSAHLISYDDEQNISDFITVNIKKKTIENYRENFQTLDPIKNKYFNQPQAIKSTLLFDYNKWTRKSYFKDFLDVHDFYYLCGIDIHNHQKILITISLIRNKYESDFTTPELLFLNRISPSISSHIILLKELNPDSFHRKRFAANVDIFNFTPREKEIARLVKTGLSNKEISERLLISVNTVKKHLQNIYKKSEVGSKRALITKLYDI